MIPVAHAAPDFGGIKPGHCDKRRGKFDRRGRNPGDGSGDDNDSDSDNNDEDEDPGASSPADPVGNSVDPKLSGAVLSAMRASYRPAVELDHLTNRMGVASCKEGGSGFWLRMNCIAPETNAGKGDLKSYSTMAQAGRDFENREDGCRSLFGAAVDCKRMESDCQNVDGEGNSDCFGLMVHGTWLRESGMVSDLANRRGRLSNGFEIVSFNGGSIKAGCLNNLRRASVEFGSKPLNLRERSGFPAVSSFIGR